MAYSFTTSGATPTQGYLGGPTKPASPFGYGTTPAAKALGGSNFQTLSGQNTSAQMPSLSAFSALGAKAPPPPSTPVKKSTVNNVDGSSHITEYHAPTGGMIQTDTPQGDTSTKTTASQTPTFPGILGSLVNNSQAGSPMAGTAGKGLLKAPDQNGLISQRAEEVRNLYGGKIAEVGRLGAGAQAGDLSTGTNVVGSGNAAIASQSASQRMSALAADEQANLAALDPQLTAQNQAQSALTSAGSLGNTAQGQLQSGLTSAGNLASPLQLPYSNQLVSPTNGQAVNGGVGGSLQDAVSQITQRIQSGQMSYDQGIQALQGYGQGGTDALQQALGPNFNIAQSNALAGQQGTIGPAYSYAKTALTNLQDAVKGLSGAQSTNIPIINMITQGLSTTFGVGSQGVQAYKGALAEARSAIQKVLASVQGGTPTDYVGQSNALLPDNATPNQIAAASQTLDTLGQAKVDIYGNPGASNTNSNAQSNPPGWF